MQSRAAATGADYIASLIDARFRPRGDLSRQGWGAVELYPVSSQAPTKQGRGDLARGECDRYSARLLRRGAPRKDNWVYSVPRIRSLTVC